MATPDNEVRKERSKEVAELGKRFFSWQTLSSFGGSVIAVKILWEALKDLNLGGHEFTSNVFPFWASITLVFAIAIFSEPDYRVEPTNWQQKGQKFIQTVFNSFLVFAAVVGVTTVTA